MSATDYQLLKVRSGTAMRTAPGGLVGCSGLICRCCGAQKIFFNQHSFTRNIKQHLIWFFQGGGYKVRAGYLTGSCMKAGLWDVILIEPGIVCVSVCLFVCLYLCVWLSHAPPQHSYSQIDRNVWFIILIWIFHFPHNVPSFIPTHFASSLTSFGRKLISILVGFIPDILKTFSH